MRDFDKNVMPRLAMQIVCPNCTTAYEVPDSVFGGKARKLRCEHCGTQWRAGPPDAESAPAEAEAPQPAPSAWPEDVIPPALEAGRVFGKPADARAQAEFRQAMDRETQPAGQPAPFLAADPQADAEDPFINLVMAARSRAIEFEPEPPPAPRVRITSPALVGSLLTLFVLSFAFMLLAHR